MLGTAHIQRLCVWREKIAEVAGLPPLQMMEGFWEPSGYRDPMTLVKDGIAKSLLQHLFTSLPIRWESLKPDPLFVLLHHSDCEGEIAPQDCGPIADRLESLLPLLEDEGDGGGHIGSYREKDGAFH